MNIKVQCYNIKGSMEKNIKSKITLGVLSKSKTEEFGVKNLSEALLAENNPLVNKLKYKDNQRDPLGLISPLYLGSPSFYYQQTTWSVVFTSFLDPKYHSIAPPLLTG